MQEATSLDHNDDGPQTTYEGQRWTVEVEFYLPGEYTEEQVEQGIEWALGGGSIESDHPLIDGDFRHVSAFYAKATGEHKFTDWQARKADGSRSGRGRTERAARASEQAA